MAGSAVAGNHLHSVIENRERQWSSFLSKILIMTLGDNTLTFTDHLSKGLTKELLTLSFSNKERQTLQYSE